MLKKTITFMDFNDNERTEDFYFNLTKTELTKLNFGKTGGLTEIIKKITSTQDLPKIIAMFEEIITYSYGEKSLDGRTFIKNDEVLAAFTQTNAYSQLYMELATNATSAAAFIEGIVPRDIAEEMAKEAAKEAATQPPVTEE